MGTFLAKNWYEKTQSETGIASEMRSEMAPRSFLAAS